MLLKILYVIVFAGVNILAPIFVKAQRNGACPKSLALKMTAATGYVVTGVLGVFISGNFSEFTKIMLIALACSWIGDLFLHLWQHKAFYGIGFLGFLSAHFFFIGAFSKIIVQYAPDRSFFVIWEIVAVVIFDVFFIVFSKLIGTNIKGVIAVPLVVYATVIVTMLCKSCEMSILLIQNMASNAIIATVCAVLGALCFVASDFTIAILLFNEKHKKNYPLKMFNIVSYFIAVLLLSATVLFIA